MRIPVPLCYKSIFTCSGGTLAWIFHDQSQEIETSFHIPEKDIGQAFDVETTASMPQKGHRRGARQSGLVAAHIDDCIPLCDASQKINKSPDSYYVWNRSFSTGSRYTRTVNIIGCYNTHDRQYCYNASIQLIASYDRKSEIASLSLGKKEPTCTVWCALLSDMQHVVDVGPPYTRSLKGLKGSFSLKDELSGFGSQQHVPKEKPVATFSLMSLRDLTQIAVRKRELAWETVNYTSDPRTTILDHWESPDWEAIVNELLSDFQFNDAALCARNRKGEPYGSYTFEWLIQHAYYAALEAIPKLSDNSIQNVQAGVGMIAALARGEVPMLPSFLRTDYANWRQVASDAWLQYRYEYSTTALDVNEAGAFAAYLIDRYSRPVQCSRAHGVAHYGDITAKCSLTWAEKGLSGLSAWSKAVWQSGFEPNAYVLWDFVPYSFVVDWFIPVGNVLAVQSNARFRNAEYFDIKDVVFSLRYDTGPKEGLTASHYVRWCQPPLAELDESYWFDEGGCSTSPTTTIKRILDAGSLMTGVFSRR